MLKPVRADWEKHSLCGAQPLITLSQVCRFSRSHSKQSTVYVGITELGGCARRMAPLGRSDQRRRCHQEMSGERSVPRSQMGMVQMCRFMNPLSPDALHCLCCWTEPRDSHFDRPGGQSLEGVYKGVTPMNLPDHRRRHLTPTAG